MRLQLNLVVPRELLCVTDTMSGTKLLADTGAAYSVLPACSQTVAGSLPRLKGAGGHSITCYGEWKLELCFSGRRFTWNFLLEAFKTLLLGADFLRHYRLIGNLAAGCLMDAATLQPIGSSATTGGGGVVGSVGGHAAGAARTH
jgi:hypothetical protein